MDPMQDETVTFELRNRAAFPPSAKRVRIILSKMDRKSPGSILDAGCGTGWVSYFLQKAGMRTIMLDFSRENLSRCSLLKMDRMLLSPLIRGSVTHLPFGDETFDAILLLDVIEHVPLLSRCMNEISRVLALGGTLFMTIPNKFGTYTLIYDMFGRKLFGGKISDHVHYLSVQDLRGLLVRHGLLIESLENIECLSPLFHMISRNLKYGKRVILPLSRMDVSLSDHLPRQIASEWFVTATKVVTSRRRTELAI